MWQRENVNDVADSIANSDCIAFSNYVWNKSFNYALAKIVKKLNPNAIIIFGGPETPISNTKLFSIHPYIDVVVKKEGEGGFNRSLQQF